MLDRAAALLDSLGATLDAGGAPSGDMAMDHDALAGLVEDQARAIRLGDAAALELTLADPSLAGRLPFSTGDLLREHKADGSELGRRGRHGAGGSRRGPARRG